MLRRAKPPFDAYPDDFENAAYQRYRPHFRPGWRLWLRFGLPRLLVAGMILALIGVGGAGAWLLLPAAEPKIIIITPPPSADSLPPIQGDFPPEVPQTYLLTPARVDHTLNAGERHAYRFFLEPPGLIWVITFYTVATLDGVISVYNTDGILLNQQNALNNTEAMVITLTATEAAQYAILIESAGDRTSAGGYTLTILPQR